MFNYNKYVKNAYAIIIQAYFEVLSPSFLPTGSPNTTWPFIIYRRVWAKSPVYKIRNKNRRNCISRRRSCRQQKYFTNFDRRPRVHLIWTKCNNPVNCLVRISLLIMARLREKWYYSFIEHSITVHVSSSGLDRGRIENGFDEKIPGVIKTFWYFIQQKCIVTRHPRDFGAQET